VDGVDRFEHSDLVPVRRCASRQQAEQYALVLAAMGMQSSIVRVGELRVLSVGYRDAARATYELAAYDRENHETLPRRDSPLPKPPRLEVALSYWALLLFFFAAARHQAFSLDWLGKGAAQSGLMLQGEWWRVVTALCLHASSVHLLGNLVFGTVFLLLLAQLTGAGVATLSMVAAGAMGNVLNALVQMPQHTSIGASTAIFAGLGIIAALRQSTRQGHFVSKLRNWTPFGGGLALLAFLGFSGENTDIVAHVMGFGSGLVAGFVLSKWDRDWTSDSGVQWMCAGTAGLLVVAAWVAAAAT
jgi:rhomboid protease GluP